MTNDQLNAKVAQLRVSLQSVAALAVEAQGELPDEDDDVDEIADCDVAEVESLLEDIGDDLSVAEDLVEAVSKAVEQ
jgi:hypothetical protein